MNRFSSEDSVYTKGLYCVRFGGGGYFLKIVVTYVPPTFEKTGLERFQLQLF